MEKSSYPLANLGWLSIVSSLTRKRGAAQQSDIAVSVTQSAAINSREPQHWAGLSPTRAGQNSLCHISDTHTHTHTVRL